jgi:hypothetical protein
MDESCSVARVERSDSIAWADAPNGLVCSDNTRLVTSALLTEVLRDFLQYLQAGAKTVPRLSYDRFLPNSFQFIIH